MALLSAQLYSLSLPLQAPSLPPALTYPAPHSHHCSSDGSWMACIGFTCVPARNALFRRVGLPNSLLYPQRFLLKNVIRSHCLLSCLKTSTSFCINNKVSTTCSVCLQYPITPHFFVSCACCTPSPIMFFPPCLIENSSYPSRPDSNEL